MSDSPLAAAWVMPEVLGPVIAARNRSGSATSAASHERRGRENAFEAARAAGYAAGHAAAVAAEERAQSVCQRLHSLLASLSKPLAEMEAGVEHELTLLALQIGKQLARRELKVDVSQIVAIVRESLAQLPVQARNVRLLVHPSDAAVLHDCLALADQSAAWSLVEDPVLTPGGCKVESEHSSVDASFEARVAAIIATLLDSVPAAVERS